jgi:hypothetical protein
MLANYSQHQRRNKMDLITVLLFIGLGILVFITTQLVAILFLLKHNQELIQDINDNTPPF